MQQVNFFEFNFGVEGREGKKVYRWPHQIMYRTVESEYVD